MNGVGVKMLAGGDYLKDPACSFRCMTKLYVNGIMLTYQGPI